MQPGPPNGGSRNTWTRGSPAGVKQPSWIGEDTANFQLGGREKHTGADDPRHVLQKHGGLADLWYMDDFDILVDGAGALSPRLGSSFNRTVHSRDSSLDAQPSVRSSRAAAMLRVWVGTQNLERKMTGQN